ncbi:PREDICTED: probable bifunctional methylenetetrahydrofolate dehydrogenase/cyclohydrolase 2 [Chaetura pelagica]|uniref:probable bifunctional methylenetetrahydrofolate dehydrogenase/cyclohydrolase 2 n=1 Tax=Chaetura pelagica TaxID=8897 RepID=UPI000523E4D0|nr:PREDICTED: probable bifunctional methylenetetrahydrofolate dehydrogenase/cyclohydrolase 2 [Chaetura pelagica]
MNLLWFNKTKCKVQQLRPGELRCRCPRTVSELIPPRRLARLELLAEGPHCAVPELIATTKRGQTVCLSPAAPWVKLMLTRLLSRHPVAVRVPGAASPPAGLPGPLRALPPPRRLARLELLAEGPHCAVPELIATTKRGQTVCLSPAAPWVKLMLTRLLSRYLRGRGCFYRIVFTLLLQYQVIVPRNSANDEATIISGTKLAKQVLKEVQRDVESWISFGNKRPHLTVILVGDNPASHIYVRNKIKAAAAVGISSEIILRPEDISQEELLDMTVKLNKDSRVSGLLVQLPLPDHIDERTVCNAIAPEKDVDGFHIMNIGRLCLDQPSVIPATAAAVWEIIKRTGIQTFGKNVVVAGRSKNVGMPISMLLHSDGEHERPGGDATVTITHRYTPKEQLKIHTQLADIVIVAAGIPKLITTDMVKEGAAVIDIGINHIHDPLTGKTKLVGDVDFEEVKKKAGFITPVPGGVGPMTVAMLLKNTLLVAKKLIY